MPTEKTHGGPGRGQGRKPLAEGEQTVMFALRMTVAQREKLALLGGAEWVRGKIDKAKTPNAGVQAAEPAQHAKVAPGTKC